MARSSAKVLVVSLHCTHKMHTQRHRTGDVLAYCVLLFDIRMVADGQESIRKLVSFHTRRIYQMNEIR